MTKVTFVDLKPDSSLHGALLNAYDHVIHSGRYIGGRVVTNFEELWAEYCGAKHCIAMQSGTQALQLLVGNDRYVAPVESVPTLEALRHHFITPAFSDLDYDWKNVIVVHLYGIPAKVPSGCKNVIEDCCQAHGAKIDGEPVGKKGFAAAWSFYPTKNLGAYGDAGAITTDDDEIAEMLRTIVAARMDPLQAAFLRVKLRYLDYWNERRREIAEQYMEGLENVGLPIIPEGAEPSWHLFVIRHPNRDQLKNELFERGIETMVHYPGTEEVLSLPCAPHLRDDQVQYVIEAVNQCAC